MRNEAIILWILFIVPPKRLSALKFRSWWLRNASSYYFHVSRGVRSIVIYGTKDRGLPIGTQFVGKQGCNNLDKFIVLRISKLPTTNREEIDIKDSLSLSIAFVTLPFILDGSQPHNPQFEGLLEQSNCLKNRKTPIIREI